MEDEGNTLVRFQIEKLDNNTFLATLVAQANSSDLRGGQPYDDEGALYYVVAVVFIYGFSIILMIGSLIKKNKGDNGVSKYMKDMDKVRRMERRQRKYQTRLAMSAAGGSRRASRALAARGIHCPSGEAIGPHSAPPVTMADASFHWDANERGENNTHDGPPKAPLLSRPPPGRARPVSPRPPGQRHCALQEEPPVITIPPNTLHIPDRTLEMADGGGSRSPSPLRSPARKQDLQLSPRKLGVDSNIDAHCDTAVLFIENEKDSKCKVALIQAQLGTVHEVEEEHAQTEMARMYNV